MACEILWMLLRGCDIYIYIYIYLDVELLERRKARALPWRLPPARVDEEPQRQGDPDALPRPFPLCNSPLQLLVEFGGGRGGAGGVQRGGDTWEHRWCV